MDLAHGADDVLAERQRRRARRVEAGGHRSTGRAARRAPSPQRSRATRRRRRAPRLRRSRPRVPRTRAAARRCDHRADTRGRSRTAARPARRCDSLNRIARSRPGRIDGRSRSSSATSGLVTGIASGGSCAPARSSARRNVSVIASSRPSPSSTWRSWRRRACVAASRPCTVDFGTAVPILVVAVVAGDLFDDVDLARRVGAPRRQLHRHHVAGLPLGVVADRRRSAMRSSRRRATSRGSGSPATPARRRCAPPAAARRDVRRPRRRGRRATGTSRASSSTKRACAIGIPYGSTPRSKRPDASERTPIRFIVRVIAVCSKYAISSATTVVASVISESWPPITPPTPIGTSLASQISRSSAVIVRSTPSRVVIARRRERAGCGTRPRRACRGRTRGSAG